MAITRLLIGLLCVVVLAAAYALLARFVLHGPVSGKSLAVSVARASGTRDDDCGRGVSRDEWQCVASDYSGSGVAEYRVRVRPGSSCWEANLTHNPSGMDVPRNVRGCAHRWQWSLFDLFEPLPKLFPWAVYVTLVVAAWNVRRHARDSAPAATAQSRQEPGDEPHSGVYDEPNRPRRRET